MPQMGVSVTEGTITKWLRQVGDAIGRDEPLLEISTDKVDTEVPSPAEGVVAQILVAEGETVEVGTVLAVIAPAGAAIAPPEPASAPPAPAPVVVVPPAMVAPEVPVAAPAAAPQVAAPTPAPAPAPAPSVSGNGRTFVSPVVARIAAEHGVDPSVVPGTGTGGRVTKKDILAYLESGAAAAPAPELAPAPEPAPAPVTPEPEPVASEPMPVAAVPAPPAPPAPAPPAPAPAPVAAAPAATVAEMPAQAPGEVLEPMTAMRRGIAEHMRRSLDTSAHVTSAIEVDMSRVVALRKKLKPEYEANHGVNVTYLAFVARAVVETIKDYPWVNGEIRGEQIVTRGNVNLGFAVELADGKGLIVPVLRNAETLNLLGIAKGVTDIAQRARDKKLLPDEVQGGTFTITNPGGYGTFHGTPVISQPQAAILGTYAVVKRPWVVQDEMGQDVIAIRPIMNLTLTYDHRLVDGALAGRFLRDLRERLETWDEAAY
ncbi:MAG: Dihydrolipoamide acetyltransferase component of pyruvate dehydrogenase complex [Thermoleophilia bacterium]|nr:Dihydrolipoamide acetyltransferase component of pyruvate dehydrogenase complex [Thermoleophilia bacterium]